MLTGEFSDLPPKSWHDCTCHIYSFWQLYGLLAELANANPTILKYARQRLLGGASRRSATSHAALLRFAPLYPCETVGDPNENVSWAT